MPVDWAIEDLPDGGRTIWCSEHEPMGRMKGMHGVTLRPNSSVVELRVRLFNRTAIVNTFLWWANVCARVHDRYQSFFPPDVRYVFDHAKRAVSTFPIAMATTTESTTDRVGQLRPISPGTTTFPFDFLHGNRYTRRVLRWIRPCRGRGLRALGRSPHLARKEAVDVG